MKGGGSYWGGRGRIGEEEEGRGVEGKVVGGRREWWGGMLRGGEEGRSGVWVGEGAEQVGRGTK